MQTVLTLLTLTVITEAITQLFVKSEIFRPVREFIEFNFLSSFTATVLYCPYCFSFWAGVIVISIFNLSGNYLFYLNLPITYDILTWGINFLAQILVIHRSSNFLHGFSDRYFSTAKDSRYINIFSELEVENKKL